MSTSETINIKKIHADDVLLLQSIGRQTFKETFADGNTEENMRKYLEEGFSIEKLTSELNDKNAAFYLAENSDNVVGYVWLGVWEENPRAIRFYEKNGFVAFDKHIFRLGDDEQTDIMMKKKLEY